MLAVMRRPSSINTFPFLFLISNVAISPRIRVGTSSTIALIFVHLMLSKNISCIFSGLL